MFHRYTCPRFLVRPHVHASNEISSNGSDSHPLNTSVCQCIGLMNHTDSLTPN